MFDGRRLDIRIGNHIVVSGYDGFSEDVRKRFIVRSLSPNYQTAIITACKPNYSPGKFSWENSYRLQVSHQHVLVKSIPKSKNSNTGFAFKPLNETDGLDSGNRIEGYIARENDNNASINYGMYFGTTASINNTHGKIRVGVVDGKLTIVIDIDQGGEDLDVVVHNNTTKALV